MQKYPVVALIMISLLTLSCRSQRATDEGTVKATASEEDPITVSVLSNDTRFQAKLKNGDNLCRDLEQAFILEQQSIEQLGAASEKVFKVQKNDQSRAVESYVFIGRSPIEVAHDGTTRWINGTSYQTAYLSIDQGVATFLFEKDGESLCFDLDMNKINCGQ